MLSYSKIVCCLMFSILSLTICYGNVLWNPETQFIKDDIGPKCENIINAGFIVNDFEYLEGDVFNTNLEWELGGINQYGLETDTNYQIRSGYIETFSGAKVIFTPDIADKFVIRIYSYIKNVDGSYRVKNDCLEEKCYDVEKRIVNISEHCFIRILIIPDIESLHILKDYKNLTKMIKVETNPFLCECDNVKKIIIEATNKVVDLLNLCSENRNVQNEDTLTFTWASDLHYHIGNSEPNGVGRDTLIEMAKVSNFVNSDFVIITGDIVTGYFSIDIQKKDLQDVVNTLNSNSQIPKYYSQGNHDDNSWYASGGGDSAGKPSGIGEILSADQFNLVTLDNSDEKIVVDESTPLGGYYYLDFNKEKIRVIVLNCEDIPYYQNEDLSLKYYGQWTMGFRQNQLEWLANKALKFEEEGWGIVVFLHSDNNLKENKQVMINIGLVNSILRAFKEKTDGVAQSDYEDFQVYFCYSFIDNPSNEIISWFSGHIHKDAYESIENVPHISIVNIYRDDVGGYDIVTIDRKNRKIILKRYKGQRLSLYDREIDY